jgi:TPR repeat protein
MRQCELRLDPKLSGDGRRPRSCAIKRNARYHGFAMALFCLAQMLAAQQPLAMKTLDIDTPQQRASGGDALAMNELGNRYLEGAGVKENAAEARIWYQKAADKGDPSAEINLASLYRHGTGGSQDYTKAVALYSKAADQGIAVAQEKLGLLYQEGTGVPKDLSQALILFRKAADQGYADAQASLGAMYFDGTGIPKDEAKAAIWERKAADQDNLAGEMNLAMMYHDGSGVPQDNEQALALFRKAAAHGNAVAQHAIGYMYFKGEGVPKDNGQAAMWFRGAAEQGNDQGEFDLGMLYEMGMGVPQNTAEAKNWLQKAAAQGNTHATAALAKIEASGSVVGRTAPDAAAGGVTGMTRVTGMTNTGSTAMPKTDPSTARTCRAIVEMAAHHDQYGAFAQYGAGSDPVDPAAAENRALAVLASKGADIRDRSRVFVLAKGCEHSHGAIAGTLKDAPSGDVHKILPVFAEFEGMLSDSRSEAEEKTLATCHASVAAQRIFRDECRIVESW